MRCEMLIQRLVRCHWDRPHMNAVKVAYRGHFGRDLQEALKDATGSSEWGQFCHRMCFTGMPDEVKRVRPIKIKD